MKNCPMKSARFLIVALLTFMIAAACASATLHQHSRKTLRFSGQVLDSVSHRPIAAVLVRLSDEKGCGYGEALTDSLGHFVLHLNWKPEGPVYASVKTTYYEGRVLIVPDNLVPVVVRLHRNRFRFAAASCGPLADSGRVNPYASQRLLGMWPSEGFQVFYMANPLKRPAGYLRTITFDEARIGNICSMFRLRMFAVDGRTREPGGNILTENVRLCLFREPWRTPKLVTYDISSFEITVPTGGFYLGLEEITSSDAFHTCPDDLPNYSPKGTILRAPCSYEQCRTWTWKNALTTEGRWTPPAEKCWPLYESALSVEVEPVPAKR